MGMRKAGSGVFEYVLQQHGLLPEEILLTTVHHLKTAEELGMQSPSHRRKHWKVICTAQVLQNSKFKLI